MYLAIITLSLIHPILIDILKLTCLKSIIIQAKYEQRIIRLF